MTSYRRAVVTAFALVLSASPSAQPPQEQTDIPRFRGGVELVQLDVSVLDRDRRPVTGLTASDFTVLENGRERPVRAFAPVRLRPLTAMAATSVDAAIPANVATNQIANQDGRLVFILMDRTIPLGQPTLTARRIATAAVEALGPGDLAAVITTSGLIPQTLTTDRTRLLAAVHRGDPSTGISKEQEAIPTLGKLDPLSDGRCLCGLCVLDTVTRVADGVRHVARRRKALLFIGSSLILQVQPRDMQLDVGCDTRVEDARRRMFDSLALAHLTVHSIDPSGMVNVGPQTRSGVPGGQGVPNPQAMRRQMFQAETNEHLANQGTLRVLPELTGGRAVMNTNGPEQDVPAIFDETGSYYVLAFEPATPPREHDTRKIEVRVRREGVRVHAQREHAPQPVSPAAGAAQQSGVPVPLQQALQGLLPNADRPLTMALAAFSASAGANALVTINVDVGAFADVNGKAVPLDFAVIALDRFGRQVTSARQTSTITFPAGTMTAAVEANVQTHLELEPGEYEVRLGVADRGRGLTASVYAEIAVPKFGSEPLALSDVTFETSGGRGPIAAAPGPTTRRQFARDERVRAILQVYQGTQQTSPLLPVTVRVRIADAAGRAVRDQLIRFAEQAFTDRRASVAADLDGLPAGDYALTFDASISDRSDRTSTRTVRFGVR